MNRCPEPAEYLLRIDDLCPTVHARRWDRLRRLIDEFSLRPVLAIVPANRDSELEASPPDPGFWQQMREYQSAGAATAIHGFDHVCIQLGKPLIRLHRQSEFAGLSSAEQRQRIASGRDILCGHGLKPEIWVAPRHSFDWNTLRALREEGIFYLSDGFSRMPFERGGVTWIPMQLWDPFYRRRGLWTICIHPNSLTKSRWERLRAFLQLHGDLFTSFDRIAADYPPGPLAALERIYEIAATSRMRVRRLAHARRRWSVAPV